MCPRGPAVFGGPVLLRLSGAQVDDLPGVDDVALFDGEVVDSVDAVFEAAENKPVTARADLQKVVAETAGEDIVAGTAGHSPDA